MTAPFKSWTVLKHGPLVPVEDDLLTVEGEIQMPVATMPRRMTVVRLTDGRLIIYSAIALAEHEMKRIEGFGVPAFLIVPNDHHRLDARSWKDRYPGLTVIAPEGSREKIEKVVRVDAIAASFPDPNVKLVVVPGTRAHEMALEVTRPDGTTLIVNDIIGNVRGAVGFGGWFLTLMGFAGDEPHVPLPVKLGMVADRAALAEQLHRWAGLRLKRILVSHGEPIEDDPRGALNALAASLT